MKHVLATLLLLVFLVSVARSSDASAPPRGPATVAALAAPATEANRANLQPPAVAAVSEGQPAVEFVKRHWFAAFSFLLAAIGGVPGFLGILDRRKNKALFHFALAAMFSGTRSGDGRTVVILTGTVSNDGKSPLAPAFFGLECKIGRGGWVTFDKELIPTNLRLEPGFEITSTRPLPETDIGRFSGSIAEGQPIHGQIAFSSNVMSANEFQAASRERKLKMRMTCTDVFNRRHVCDIVINKDSGQHTEGTMDYVQQGVAYKRTKPEAPPATAAE